MDEEDEQPEPVFIKLEPKKNDAVNNSTGSSQTNDGKTPKAPTLKRCFVVLEEIDPKLMKGCLSATESVSSTSRDALDMEPQIKKEKIESEDPLDVPCMKEEEEILADTSLEDSSSFSPSATGIKVEPTSDEEIDIKDHFLDTCLQNSIMATPSTLLKASNVFSGGKISIKTEENLKPANFSDNIGIIKDEGITYIPTDFSVFSESKKNQSVDSSSVTSILLNILSKSKNHDTQNNLLTSSRSIHCSPPSEFGADPEDTPADQSQITSVCFNKPENNIINNALGSGIKVKSNKELLSMQFNSLPVVQECNLPQNNSKQLTGADPPIWSLDDPLNKDNISNVNLLQKCIFFPAAVLEPYNENGKQCPATLEGVFKVNSESEALLESCNKKRFSCQQCPGQFKTNSILKRHCRTVHSDERPFSCVHCPLKFKVSYYLKRHLRTHFMERSVSSEQNSEKLECSSVINVDSSVQSNESFSCEQCSAKFKTSLDLKKHSETHLAERPSFELSNERPFHCVQCSAKFKTNHDLRRHFRITHSDERPFSCVHCSAKFKVRDYLKKHLRTHFIERSVSSEQNSEKLECNSVVNVDSSVQSNESFSCEQCSAKFKTSLDLKKHSETHAAERSSFELSNERRFHCVQCSAKFKTSYDLRRHFGTVHSDERPFSCVHCSAKFKARDYLRRHLKTHFIERVVSSEQNTEKSECSSLINVDSSVQSNESLSCKQCPAEFKTSSDLKKHSKTHFAERPSFELYSVKLETNSDLNLHSTVQSNAKPFSCDQCSDKFISSSNLKKHSKTHNAGGPFSCEHCPAKYKFWHLLRNHLKIHLNGPSSCKLCSLGFKTDSDLKEHYLSYHGIEKPFSCEHCSAKFKTSLDLKQHSLFIACAVSQYENSFPCNQCGIRFKIRLSLINHILRAHSIERCFPSNQPQVLAAKFEFERKRTAKSHLRSFSKRKPYFCKRCGKEYASKAGYKGHHRKHFYDTPYTCNRCAEKFRTVASLGDHSCNAAASTICTNDPITSSLVDNTEAVSNEYFSLSSNFLSGFDAISTTQGCIPSETESPQESFVSCSVEVRNDMMTDSGCYSDVNTVSNESPTEISASKLIASKQNLPQSSDETFPYELCATQFQDEIDLQTHRNKLQETFINSSEIKNEVTSDLENYVDVNTASNESPMEISTSTANAPTESLTPFNEGILPYKLCASQLQDENDLQAQADEPQDSFVDCSSRIKSEIISDLDNCVDKTVSCESSMEISASALTFLQESSPSLSEEILPYEFCATQFHDVSDLQTDSKKLLEPFVDCVSRDKNEVSTGSYICADVNTTSNESPMEISVSKFIDSKESLTSFSEEMSPYELCASQLQDENDLQAQADEPQDSFVDCSSRIKSEIVTDLDNCVDKTANNENLMEISASIPTASTESSPPFSEEILPSELCATQFQDASDLPTDSNKLQEPFFDCLARDKNEVITGLDNCGDMNTTSNES